MKKRWLSILLIVLTMVFTGCTSTQLEFWNKIQATQEWKATQVKGTLNMAMTMQGKKVNVAVDLEGTSNTKDATSLVNMTLTMDNPLVAGETVKINDIKMYMVDGKFAISKNYFTGLLELSGQEIPQELLSEAIEYIVLEMNPLQQQFLTSLTKDPNAIKEWYNTFAKMAGEMDLQVDVTKKDNTYSIEIDQTEMSHIIKDIIVKGTNHLESLNQTFKLGLTTEEIKQAQAEMNSVQAEMDQIVQMISTMLTGSLKIDYTVEEQGVTEKVTLTVDEPTFTGLKMNMNSTMTSRETEPIVIKMPEKGLKLTDEELTELLVGKVVMIDTTSNRMTTATGENVDCKVMIENSKVLIPAKTVLGALGQEVLYDAQAKKVGIKVQDVFKALNVVTKENIAYITLDELQALGYTVMQQGGYITIQ